MQLCKGLRAGAFAPMRMTMNGYDLSVPNEKPGVCAKCKGSGLYRWGAIVNGRATHCGQCHSCGGTGKQSARDIRRNHAYNKHKIAAICAAM